MNENHKGTMKRPMGRCFLVAKKCLQTAELTGVNFVSTGLRAKNVF
jgi:hypothetical protein